MSNVERGGLSKLAETGRRRLQVGAATLLSVLAIGGAVEAAAGRADEPVTPPETPQQQLQDCEYQAYYSFNGARLKYVVRKGIRNLFMREYVSATGAPACEGVADVKWMTQEYMGPRGHLHPNTDPATVHDGTDAFSGSILQRGYRYFQSTPHNPRFIQQRTYIEITPNDPNAGDPVTYEYASKPAGVR